MYFFSLNACLFFLILFLLFSFTFITNNFLETNNFSFILENSKDHTVTKITDVSSNLYKNLISIYLLIINFFVKFFFRCSSIFKILMKIYIKKEREKKFLVQ